MPERPHKRRHAWNEPGHAHFLTYSCAHRWPLFLRAIGYVYTAVFPIALIALGVWKLVADWSLRSTAPGFLALDALIVLALIVYKVLYLLWVFWKA